MRIAICGIGPAGLLAAWGAREHEVTLFDGDVSYHPERIFALQYLHDPCGVPSEAMRELALEYVIKGLDERLVAEVGEPKAARFMYNDKLRRPLSEENSTHWKFAESRPRYSLKHAYAWLHNEFQNRMVERRLDWSDVIGPLSDRYDLVVSTIPLEKILPAMTWPTMDLLITQDYVPIEIPDGTCVISVDPKDAWMRATRLDGGCATEWARWPDKLPPYARFSALRKIIPPPMLPETPDNVTLAGRWGTWDAGALTHHAYHRVRTVLATIPQPEEIA